MVVVSIEGNIGSGKTRILRELAARGYRAACMPTEQWDEWLARFYADKNRWAFALQMKVLAAFADADVSQPGFVEGSCEACRHVYGQLLFNLGLLSAKEWDLYKQFCDLVAWKPDVMVHLASPVERCLEGILDAAGGVGDPAQREGASSRVDAEYLTRIDFQYANMLKYYGGVVVTVDATRAPGEVVDDILRQLAQLGIDLSALLRAA
jgi:deoxyguanosine kinase